MAQAAVARAIPGPARGGDGDAVHRALYRYGADGVYHCAACRSPLFDSADKFDSGTGWPSFTRPLAPDRVTDHIGVSHGARRTETRCSRCDGHLGHVYTDGPPPTGLRYCLNSASLDFRGREAG